jgi:23S rRNA-/tRNA-specific pseudouridylate synthase
MIIKNVIIVFGVMIRIFTGHHHQILVHCNGLGHPLVSDNTYAQIRDNTYAQIKDNLKICPRLFLHAIYCDISMDLQVFDSIGQ